MLVAVKINSNVMNNSRNRENIQASNNNNLFLLSHGCRHPSSALAYIKGTSRERRKIDEHSTDKESTKSRTWERGQGNEKRDREREEEQRERGSPQENREKSKKTQREECPFYQHITPSSSSSPSLERASTRRER